MRKILVAAFGALAVAAMSAGVMTSPAEAHHPSWLWYKGYKYYACDYKKGYWFYHHGYIYCRGGGGGGSGY